MISQHAYITKLPTKFAIDSSSKPTTPIRTDFYTSLESSANEPVILDFPYKELVGALIFVMVCTRPDISKFCGKLSYSILFFTKSFTLGISNPLLILITLNFNFRYYIRIEP